MKKLLLILAVATIAFVSFSFYKAPLSSAASIKEASKSLVFPVAGSRSVIKDKWGASRGGGTRKHKGIDIHARKGTPVVAISDGIITTRDHTPIGGKTLWLKSSHYPLTAYYAHLDKQYVKEGQFVKKGQVIGTVGNTGNARTTPAHLHFGVIRGKSWVNPFPYVKHALKLKTAKVPQKKSNNIKKPVSRKK